MSDLVQTNAARQTSPFRSREARAAEREEKREAVLLAAVRAFNANGFHATSLDDVATSLGVSKPTIYHYLGNKDQVLLECITRGLDLLLKTADDARDLPGSGLDRLKAFLVLYAVHIMEDFGRCVVRTGEEELSPESARRFRSLKRGIDRAMRALIAEGMADGSIARADVRLTAYALAGALNWPARWHRQDGDEDPATVARMMVEILTAGLAARPSPHKA